MTPPPQPRAETAAGLFGERGGVGAAGERRTADLLAAAYDADPTTGVFHNLHVPGWKTANLDHVVVRGNNLVAIDSKHWAPGDYWTLGSTRRGWKRFPSADKIRLADQCAALARATTCTKAMAVVVIWPSRSGRVRPHRFGIPLRLPGGVAYCVGDELVDVIEKLLPFSHCAPTPQLVSQMQRLRKR